MFSQTVSGYRPFFIFVEGVTVVVMGESRRTKFGVKRGDVELVWFEIWGDCLPSTAT